MINTHDGISYEKIRRFDTDCFVHVIDMAKVKLKILNGFRTVPEGVAQGASQLGFNGGGWKSTYPWNPNEWLIIDGIVKWAKTLDFRPCMAFMKDGSFSIVNQPNFQTTLNTIGFDRRIAEDGVYNSKISDNSVAPRTVYGKDIYGHLVILVCEGRLDGQKGLTFKEVWEVMREYNVTDCGNADGGYSSAAINTAMGIFPLNKSYFGEVPNRRTVYQVLFYATPTGEVPPIEPPVEPPPVEEPRPTPVSIDITWDDGFVETWKLVK